MATYLDCTGQARELHRLVRMEHRSIVGASRYGAVLFSEEYSSQGKRAGYVQVLLTYIIYVVREACWLRLPHGSREKSLSSMAANSSFFAAHTQPAIMVAGLDGDVPVEIDAYELLWRARARVHLPETIVRHGGPPLLPHRTIS